MGPPGVHTSMTALSSWARGTLPLELLFANANLPLWDSNRDVREVAKTREKEPLSRTLALSGLGALTPSTPGRERAARMVSGDQKRCPHRESRRVDALLSSAC
jgi:hypothetical protein